MALCHRPFRRLPNVDSLADVNRALKVVDWNFRQIYECGGIIPPSLVTSVQPIFPAMTSIYQAFRHCETTTSGVRWVLWREQFGLQRYQLSYSADSGASWAVGSEPCPSTAQFAGWYVDHDDIAHLLYADSASIWWYRRGTHTGTGWNWSTAWTWPVANQGPNNSEGLEIVAFKIGGATYLHWGQAAFATSGRALYGRLAVVDNGVGVDPTVTVHQARLQTASGRRYVYLDFDRDPTNPKVPSATPHIYFQAGTTRAPANIVWWRFEYSAGPTWNTSNIGVSGGEQFIASENISYLYMFVVAGTVWVVGGRRSPGSLRPPAEVDRMSISSFNAAIGGLVIAYPDSPLIPSAAPITAYAAGVVGGTSIVFVAASKAAGNYPVGGGQPWTITFDTVTGLWGAWTEIDGGVAERGVIQHYGWSGDPVTFSYRGIRCEPYVAASAGRGPWWAAIAYDGAPAAQLWAGST